MDFKHKKEAEAIEGYGARSARVGACDILTLNRYVLVPLRTVMCSTVASTSL